MRKVALRSVWGHKRRLVSTVVSVLLGVAFMSGTLMFSDTIDKAFDSLFRQTSDGIDSVVQGEVVFSDDFAGDQRALLDPGLVDTVEGVDGVETAVPYSLLVTYSTQLLDTDGDAVGTTQGPPTLVESWVDDDELSSYRLTEGSAAPEADDEIAVNVAAAEDGGYEVGDEVTVATQDGRLTFTLVGTFTFGDSDSSGGAISLDFSLDEAITLAGSNGQISNVFVRAADGVSDTEVTDRIAAALPDGAEALTGQAFADQTAESVSSGFGFFSQLLVGFAFLALVVGMFIIYNTFQILLAQRTRELAFLRAVGASRRQVLTSVIVEAVAVATVASGLGLVVGYLLASGVLSAFSGGGDLPVDGIAVVPATLIRGFLSGFVVTVLAALAPAIRATRVPPLAALRDVAVDRAGPSKLRIGFGVLLLVLAGLNLSTGWTATDSGAVSSTALGGVLLIIVAVVLGPVLAGPSVRILAGWLPRLKGTTGRLAYENAARSPKRTSATASALLIAVTLVGFINIVAASATESVQGRVSRGFTADVYVLGQGGFGPPVGYAPELADRIGELPDVELVSSQKFTFAQVTYEDGERANVQFGSIDPATFPEVAEADMQEGEISDLTDGGVLLYRENADAHGVVVGDTVSVTLAGGAVVDLTVEGITDEVVALFQLTVTDATFVANVPEALDFFTFVKAKDGVDVDGLVTQIQGLADEYPNVDVLDQDGFIGSVAQQITQFVTLIQGLLALSILIAFIGIANTLSLSIHERTREIGLLRAVGATRNQLRSTMRWEAAIIAVLGTAVGLVVALVVSRSFIEALSSSGLDQYQIPIGTLGTIVFLAAGVSILASILPARRAAKLDVLDAISQT